MKSRHFLLALLMISVNSLSIANELKYAALATNKNGPGYGWAVDKSQERANQKAMEFCTEAYGNCRLQNHVALVVAEGSKNVGRHRSQNSLKEARKQALKACGTVDCKITVESIAPGFYSLAKSKQGNGSHLVYMIDKPGTAEQLALERCANNTQSECEIYWVGVITGEKHTTEPKSKRENSFANAPRDCRPKSSHLTCNANCFNGNCVITYKNGCQLEVHVAPVPDPFTGQMKFPNPSCHIKLN